MRLRSLLTAALAAFAFIPAAVHAVDGVILIDQNKVLAGAVTAGDAPGFPLTITQPGSYRLSGNLTAPGSVNGIVIDTDGVTIDLNGFTINGGVGAIGITDNNIARKRVTVRNGHIAGFSTGVRLLVSNQAVVEDLIIDQGAAGLAAVVGQFSRLSRNISVGNGLFQATCPSLLTENITDGFVTVFVVDSSKQCVRYHNRSQTDTAAISE